MENVMNQEQTFCYKYSATENQEVQEIRKRYLPQSESKIDELKRLDEQVQKSGMIEGLCFGIIGCLIFGTGMCLAMKVIGSTLITMLLGVLVGVIGTGGMLLAYPVYRRRQKKAKETLAPRILELAEEIYQN